MGQINISGKSMICAALLATTGAAALTVPTDAFAQATVQREFDIPAQSLREALLLFGTQSGIQVTAPGPLIEGRTSSAVAGKLAAAQALSQLLAGTGLTYRFEGSNAVRIEAAAADSAIALGPVRIEGSNGSGATGVGFEASASSVSGTLPEAYAGGQVARGAQLGLLGNQDYMDAPFSVSSFTEQTVRDLGARTPLQVLSLDPSVSRATGGTESSDQFIVRGFTAFAFQYTVNGVPSVGGVFGFDAEAYDRIELNKGPAALLNGGAASANVGGTVNLISKKATDDPISRLTAQYTQGSEGQIALDFGRRVGERGEFGIRTNIVVSDGHRNVEINPRFRRTLGDITLDYRGDGIRANLRGSVLTRYTAPYDTFAADPNFTNVSQTYALALGIRGTQIDVFEYGTQAGLEVDLAKDTTLAVNYGKRWYETKQLYAYFVNLDLASGAAEQVNGYYGERVDRDSFDATLRSRLQTGSLSHQLAITASFSPQNAYYRCCNETDPFATNIYDPISGPNAPPGNFGPLASHDNTTSFGIAETLGVFDDRLLITAGIRRVTITNDGDNDGDGVVERLYRASANTPALGVVFKATKKLSIYGNYIEGLEPGQTAPRNLNNQQFPIVNPGQIFPPTPAKQIEGGAKFDFGKLGLTLAAFRIERPAYEIDPETVTPRRFGPIGLQTNSGFEFNVFGELSPRVRVVGGYSYVDAVLSKTVNKAVEGNTPGGIPKHTATMALEWDTPFIQRLTLVGRGRVQSGQFSGADNVIRAPGKTLIGLGANYSLPVATPIVIRAFVDDVFDSRSYVSFARNRVTLEDPRTFRLSAEVSF